MGFSSFTSALSGKDIYNVHREDKHEGICAVFPDNSFVFGNYDGYGRILSKKGEIDVYVLHAIEGDLDMYFSLDEETFEELRWTGIQEFNNGGMTFKLITENELFEKLDCRVDYDKLKASKSALGQGYWDA